MSQHQEHGRTKASGTIHVPLLHGCMMLPVIDLLTQHFPLQMLQLYGVHTRHPGFPTHLVLVPFLPTEQEASIRPFSTIY